MIEFGGADLEMNQEWGHTEYARQEAEGVGIGGTSDVQHRQWGCIDYACQVAECVGVRGASPDQCRGGLVWSMPDKLQRA